MDLWRKFRASFRSNQSSRASTTTTTYQSGGASTSTSVATHISQSISYAERRVTISTTNNSSPFDTDNNKSVAGATSPNLLSRDGCTSSSLRGLPDRLSKGTSKNSDARPYQNKEPRSAFSGNPSHNYKKPPTPSSKEPSSNNNNNNVVARPIHVKKVWRLLGDPNDPKDPAYSTKSERRGCLLMINNIEFPGKGRRYGADVDQANMSELFRQMGFEVFPHQNKKKREMKEIITNHTNNQTDLKDVDISVTIIMSHGKGNKNETSIEAIDGKKISTDWIVKKFVDCEYLKGKPKIFIFQCCRGKYEDIQTDSKVYQGPSPSRKHADLLIAYSTVPDYVSYRVPATGSWYITLICEVFEEHARDTHIEDLLKAVDRRLAEKPSEYKQTSCYENRGFNKKCYLNPV